MYGNMYVHALLLVSERKMLARLIIVPVGTRVRSARQTETACLVDVLRAHLELSASNSTSPESTASCSAVVRARLNQILPTYQSALAGVCILLRVFPSPVGTRVCVCVCVCVHMCMYVYICMFSVCIVYV
jgi:hypothetical protein